MVRVRVLIPLSSTFLGSNDAFGVYLRHFTFHIQHIKYTL